MTRRAGPPTRVAVFAGRSSVTAYVVTHRGVRRDLVLRGAHLDSPGNAGNNIIAQMEQTRLDTAGVNVPEAAT